MTDPSALLAAILAAPEDDTPRLVFADWLDENEGSVVCERCGGTRWKDSRTRGIREQCPCGSGFVSNGYAARGEFIRVQCEVATMSLPCDCGHLDVCPTGRCITDLKDLRKRERELFLSAYPENRFLFGSGAWTYCLPGTPVAKGEAAVGSSVAVVERGFVDSVSCPWDDWRDHGDAIVAAQPVRKVTLATWPEYFTFDNGLKIFHFGPERKKHQFVDLFGRTYGRRDVIERLLKAEWPSVREWELPPEDRSGPGRYTMYFRRTDEVRPQDSPEPPPAR